MFLTLDTCYSKSVLTLEVSSQLPQSYIEFYFTYYLSVLFPGIIHSLSKLKTKQLIKCLEKSYTKFISMLKCYIRFLVIYNSFVLFLFLLNLILLTIANPSIKNPGPSARNRPLTVLYNNVQGFINPKDLSSPTPPLNMKKAYELQGYIFNHKPDIVILNETWLKQNILNPEIFPKSYKVSRIDRSGKTHPWDSSQPKKFRKFGGGVLIAHRLDIDCESTEVGLIKVQAELLSINFKLPTGKKLCISTFYRVGTLGMENYEQVKKYFTTLASRKKLDKHVLVGDFNFPEVEWPEATTTVELHKKFLDLFLVDLGHSQMISEPTHKNGNTLDLLFTNIPDIINKISVLDFNEVCKSDHFGIKFEIKLNVKLKKVAKRQIYNFSKANWKELNFDLKKVNWHLIGSHDPHTSWNIFKFILNKLCDKHIPKISVKDQFLPPWYDSECDKILHEKEKWRSKANSPSGTEQDHEKFRKLRSDFKKIMDQKMRLHVEDDSDPALISKKYWKHVKSKSKSS